MRKYIHVTKEDREFLAKKYGIGPRTVYNALVMDEERGNSDVCNKIRRDALERGGIVMVESPEMETFHDNDGYMRQRFPNGALLELDKMTGNGAVLWHGVAIRTYMGVMVDQIAGIQEYAASL